MGKKIYILCPFAKDSSLYSGWSSKLDLPCQLLPNYRTDWLPPDDCALVISHMHYRYEECEILRNVLKQNRVPLLILADGILEHRNTWENPAVADGTLFQPVLGHKIACIGRSQARTLESWGNIGKCEVVGMPRFDAYLKTAHTENEANRNSQNKIEPTSEQLRLLITTATTPYFDEEQKATTIQSLRDIKDFLEQNPSASGKTVKPIWRLADGLDEEIGVNSDESDSFADLLLTVDAMITTPSTLILEGWLSNRPVAILDYHNCPQYVATAWTISAKAHFPKVIQELANPPQSKLLFQEAALADHLECDSPATTRMIRLVNEIVKLAADQEADRDVNQKAFEFPIRILGDERCGLQPLASSFDATKLYENNPAFREEEIGKLQVALAQAQLRLQQLPDELLENREYIRYLIGRLDELRSRLQRRNARVWSLRQEVANLEKQLQLVEMKNSDE